jgi:hypothetical protein
MMIIEKEHIEENYREGRALNEVDEENNAETRRDFASLQAMLPVLLAAPELLAALKEVAEGCEHRLRKGKDSGDKNTLNLCREAIKKAEGA